MPLREFYIKIQNSRNPSDTVKIKGGEPMKIMSSTLAFSSSRTYDEKKSIEKRLETWTDTNPPATAKKSMTIPATPGNFIQPETSLNIDDETLSPKLAAIKRLLEELTGRKIKVSNFENMRSQAPAPIQEKLTRETWAGETPQNFGWGMRYTESNTYHESETSKFKAQGTIMTGDGKNLEFTLELEMQREFYSEESFQILAGDALKDPLVINFDGNSADLTDTRFNFDINMDGTKVAGKDESIPWLKQGSGFLVLDKNKDGIVNDGSELFGPGTGNGFIELTQLDSDGNNWIDENDPGFEDLLIWSGTSFETSTLVYLKTKGVGAIALSTAETPFTLKDTSNSTLGKIQRTGIYLNENGSVGTVQHLDIAV